MNRPAYRRNRVMDPERRSEFEAGYQVGRSGGHRICDRFKGFSIFKVEELPVWAWEAGWLEGAVQYIDEKKLTAYEAGREAHRIGMREEDWPTDLAYRWESLHAWRKGWADQQRAM